LRTFHPGSDPHDSFRVFIIMRIAELLPPSGIRVMLLGSFERGKAVIIALPRLGVEVMQTSERHGASTRPTAASIITA
jgi:formate-dependent phosphoribosylglycinamide formyltransferase (GAR transformylase)